jgi:hypothetical protein
MHASTCQCPKCQAARESAFESESFGYEFGGSASGEVASPLTEAEEVELAMELMAVSSEAEMEQFLGNVFKSAWKGLKKVGSAVGKIAKPLGGVLKSVAKTALPFVGSALGSFIPIPGVGTAVGGALGTALSKALELEYGELESEEAEFEMARRFVRIAATAAQQAASAPPAADAASAVNRALVSAARQHLPGADLRALGASTERLSGRWFRQGANIVVVGG